MYKIILLPAAVKDPNHIEHKLFLQIKVRIDGLVADPRPMNSLKLTNEQGYRLRSGDYRVLCRIDDHQKTVFVYRVKHRKDAYR